MTNLEDNQSTSYASEQCVMRCSPKLLLTIYTIFLCLGGGVGLKSRTMKLGKNWINIRYSTESVE